mmetsp:Transcript_28250/g.95129  ORF Transcript_28250/g.95129 Transcript_28250/m.95129 type:complete len:220 (-) Transcript_28250:530-1189(-)
MGEREVGRARRPRLAHFWRRRGHHPQRARRALDPPGHGILRRLPALARGPLPRRFAPRHPRLWRHLSRRPLGPRVAPPARRKGRRRADVARHFRLAVALPLVLVDHVLHRARARRHRALGRRARRGGARRRLARQLCVVLFSLPDRLQPQRSRSRRSPKAPPLGDGRHPNHAPPAVRRTVHVVRRPPRYGRLVVQFLDNVAPRRPPRLCLLERRPAALR